MKQVISDLTTSTGINVTTNHVFNLVCHDVTKLQNLNLKGFILNFLGVDKVFGNEVI